MSKATMSREKVPKRDPTAEPALLDYAEVAGVLTVVLAGLGALAWGESTPRPRESLLTPLFAQLLLVAVVWLLMVAARNAAILRGIASSEYFRSYSGELPPEFVERPARAFNNLMQVPTLFYVGVTVALALDAVTDQLAALGWAFVALRSLHAGFYIAFNVVKWRFCLWMSSGLALVFFWVEIAQST
ncbi:MAG: MAPEG family protein [Acidobacteriota bacterium]